MSAILDFSDPYQLETYITGFLDLKSHNFDPKHGLLSSIEAEIISIHAEKGIRSVMVTKGFDPYRPH